MAGGKSTTHSMKRVTGRFGLPDAAVDRQVMNALARGTKREKFYGPVRKYLDHLYRKGCNMQSATDIIVYNDNIYLFAGSILVTAWPMPNGLRDHEQKQRLSYREKDASVFAPFD